MALALRHRNDPRPRLEPLQGMTIRAEVSAAFLAALQGRTEQEMQRRFAEGHRAYVAWWSGAPAAWGWVATRAATIGELGWTFPIEPMDRYLWNFVTLPGFRGRGVYPRLLDAIVELESRTAERFWVAYAPENHASASGIARAGFRVVAELSFDADRRPALRPLAEGLGGIARRDAGIRTADHPLSACWRCVRHAGAERQACSAGACGCDDQKPAIPCGAATASEAPSSRALA